VGNSNDKQEGEGGQDRGWGVGVCGLDAKGFYLEKLPAGILTCLCEPRQVRL